MRALPVISTVVLVSCGGSAPPVAAPPPTVAAPAPEGPPARERFDTTLKAVGLDADALDRSADPCADFYEFACGNWIKKTEIPADKSRWSRSFSSIDERNEKDLENILQNAEKSEDPGEKKLGEYFGACMNEAQVEKAGLSSIQPLLAKAKALKSSKDVTPLLIELHKRKIWALFDVSAEQDFKDATEYLTYLDQNGLGLPDRDYYTKDDDKSKELREKYLAHVEAMLTLGGMPKARAKAAAADVMEIETGLAKVSKTRVERRDPEGLYNKVSRDELEKLSPGVNWNVYLKGVGLVGVPSVNVTSKPFFRGVSELVAKVPVAKWQNYFTWQILNGTAELLGKKFVDENFKMARALTGQKEIRARWKRCVDSTDEALGELLGQPFVKLRFGGDSKAAAESLVHAIGSSFGQELGHVDWMDTPTRQAAREKREAMAFLIGFPDKWKTYDFEVKAGDYAGNALRGRAFDQARILARIGKPVDRGEWEMTPPTVNAYYNPLKNQMVFPAGILQPPFYDVKASVPVNLGAMGMVVGHELTHGFDDQGSQFDKNGNLRKWWNAEVRNRFDDKTECVAHEYSQFETIPGVKLNGKLTLGENIADLGGAKLAFHAYRELSKDAKEGIADGFSEDQQFFLSVGQVWCSRQRDEYARMAAQIDPHSPPKWRVNGTLRNLPEFAEAFSCQAGTPMNPQNKCVVW